MTDASMNDTDQSEHSSSSSDATQTDDARKPFVRPELRRETDLVDGTGSSFSM